MGNRDIDKKISELNYKIAKLEAEKKRLDALTPSQRLAEALHEKMCGWNHTDGCGWFYEFICGVANWTGSAHAEYLNKAERALKLMDGDENKVLEMAKILKGL